MGTASPGRPATAALGQPGEPRGHRVRRTPSGSPEGQEHVWNSNREGPPEMLSRARLLVARRLQEADGRALTLSKSEEGYVPGPL